MDNIKKQLGEKALDYIHKNMIVGLGTGSTSEFFIHSLAKKCQNGLSIKATASSITSYNLAKKLNIPIVEMNQIDHIDIYIDGADEVDFNKNMIKGRGGALLREKILANFASKIVIMIDHTKYVEKLGKVYLPVEITPFGAKLTKNLLENLGFFSEVRKNVNGNTFITDNNNYILDLKLQSLMDDPLKIHSLIKLLPGVVDTGLFIDLADTILVGHSESKIEIIS